MWLGAGSANAPPPCRTTELIPAPGLDASRGTRLFGSRGNVESSKEGRRRGRVDSRGGG